MIVLVILVEIIICMLYIGGVSGAKETMDWARALTWPVALGIAVGRWAAEKGRYF